MSHKSDFAWRLVDDGEVKLASAYSFDEGRAVPVCNGNFDTRIGFGKARKTDRNQAAGERSRHAHAQASGYSLGELLHLRARVREVAQDRLNQPIKRTTGGRRLHHLRPPLEQTLLQLAFQFG